MKNTARNPKFPQASQEFTNGIRHNEEICCWSSLGWGFVDVLISSRRIGGPAKCVKAGGLTAPPGRGSVPPQWTTSNDRTSPYLGNETFFSRVDI